MTALEKALRSRGYETIAERLHRIGTQVLLDHICDPSKESEPVLSPFLFSHPRLKEIAVDALASSGTNWESAKLALLLAVRKDPDLLWALFEPFHGAAAQRLLAQLGAEMRAYARANFEDGNAGGGIVRAIASATKAPPRNERPPAAGLTVIGEVVRLSMLDRFKPAHDGKAIGDYTPPEARRWASARARDVRFVELLTQGLPETGFIRAYRTGDEADALYQQATDEVDG
jgi:hypothetical protein